MRLVQGRSNQENSHISFLQIAKYFAFFIIKDKIKRQNHTQLGVRPFHLYSYSVIRLHTTPAQKQKPFFIFKITLFTSQLSLPLCARYGPNQHLQRRAGSDSDAPDPPPPGAPIRVDS